MNTFEEIQEAVERLRGDEKKALSLWLNSKTEPEIISSDEQQLLRSLDDAIRDLDSGKGVSIENARKQVASWAGK
jgi:hypothetical protein